MTSPGASLAGARSNWFLLALAGLLLMVHRSSSSQVGSSNQLTNLTQDGNVSLVSVPVPSKRPCFSNNECDTYSVCQSGHCECILGYLHSEDASHCRPERCSANYDCYSIWPNSRCNSNSICACEDDFEVEYATQTCKYHLMSAIKEPYFYGPFISFVAVIILLLAIWYFCCRRRREGHTTIIFHKGDLPASFTSNTVATDQIPTISETLSTNSPSYTPLGRQIIYENPGAMYRSYSRSFAQSPNACAHCLTHQHEHLHLCSNLNGANETRHTANGYSVHLESLNYAQSAETHHSLPPSPPPYTPPYTPLSPKLPIL